MIYLNVGRREQGKTTLAYYLVQSLPVRVIFDPRALFPAGVHGRATTPAAIQAGFDRLIDERRGELIITPDISLRECFEQTTGEVKSWIQDPHTANVPIAIIADELWMVCEQRGRVPESFDWLLRCATRQSVTIVCTAHRPSDIPTNIRAIADVWCLFHCTQEHDLEVIRDRCSDAVAAKVEKLGPRQFVAWDDTRGTWAFHQHPDRWFVPLGQPIVHGGAVAIPNTAIDQLQGTPGAERSETKRLTPPLSFD